MFVGSDLYLLVAAVVEKDMEIKASYIYIISGSGTKMFIKCYVSHACDIDHRYIRATETRSRDIKSIAIRGE